MTKTARRRWSREVESEVDGIAQGGSGPVLLHGYDPPAGGKWTEDVIPGKLMAFDRSSGETLWTSPCEVGYGRGFGAGFGSDDDVILLGPSSQGHRIVRMSLGTGELLGAEAIQPFDEALVAGDMCVSITPQRIIGIMTEALMEVWAFSDTRKRFHQLARDGRNLFVSFTDKQRKKQGLIILDVESGKLRAELIAPTQRAIHGICAGEGQVIVVASDVLDIFGSGQMPQEFPDGELDELFDQKLNLVAFPSQGKGGPAQWFAPLDVRASEEFPDLHVSMDSGKLYVVQQALITARDSVSGRSLGSLAIPGLDERVGWSVSEGAGLLAEENRVSIFELPV